MKTLTRHTGRLFISLVLLCLSHQANATVLIMVEQDDCPFCDRFNDEIGPVYAKTDEGKRAPLVRLDLYEPWPETYNAIEKAPVARVTPMFILVHDGKEIDRLYGYDGDEFFWFLLGEMLEKLPD